MPLGTPARRMPIPEEVSDFLADLLGASIAAEKVSKSQKLPDAEDCVTAIYVEDDGRLGGACVADLSFAASAGAALAMMPKAIVEEATRKGELIESLHENYYEVVNILTALLAGPSVPHLRLDRLEVGIPDEVQQMYDEAAGKRQYAVSIIGYPGGKMALMAASPAKTAAKAVRPAARR